MKLVGATDNFVRRPFVVEGMLQGLVAGLLAATVLWGLYKLMAAYLPQFGSGSMLAMLVMFVLVGGSGILLGWAGSFLSVRRFIRNVALH
jgi:cell division transport system permease protein